MEQEEELALISEAPDCVEEKEYYGEELFFLIHYDILSSESLGRKATVEFLYNEKGGGAGSILTIEDL